MNIIDRFASWACWAYLNTAIGKTKAFEVIVDAVIKIGGCWE